MIRNTNDIGKVGVLSGGPSSERAVSVKSAGAVYNALVSAGIDAVLIDVSKPDMLVNQLRQNRVDIAFIALHGKFGEDGKVQSMLSEEGIPYTGSGPAASRLALDKAEAKKIFTSCGIPTPAYSLIYKHNYDIKKDDITPPCVVKPCNEGSSIGLTIVDEPEGIIPALKKAFLYDDRAIAEDYITGDDITVGIFNDSPLPVILIKPKDRFYDYYCKYTAGASRYIVPAKLPEDATRTARYLAIAAHKALGCEHFSRVDMIFNQKSKEIMVLEVNTIPGFTETSLLPKAAGKAGISFSDMCISMLRHALTKKGSAKRALRNFEQNKVRA